MDIERKIRGIKKLINNRAIIDSVDVLILIQEIEKQKKMIELMAEQLAGIAIWDNKKEEPLILMSKEEVIKYYERKAKENERK